MVVIERASSSSSSSSSLKRKEKPSVSCQKDSHELLKKKINRKTSSISSPSASSRKVNKSKDIHIHDELPKEKITQKPSSKSALFKSRIKELGPICKRRKETLAVIVPPVSTQVEEDIDEYLDKQIEDDCFWLSSGSMSPRDFGMFPSDLDPCIDEWVISILPRSSITSSNTFEASIGEEKSIQKYVGNESNASSFWNMDRTDVWVSLINLNGDDSKWISDFDSQSEDLESNFPSPTYEINWDSYSSDIGFSSSAKSTQGNSQSELSSELLSESMDWDFDSNDPLFWPYGMDFDEGWDSFLVSPRKGTHDTSTKSPTTIKFRIHGRKGNSKQGLKRKILFVSGLNASKIIEFKRGNHKKRGSKFSKQRGHYKRRISTILENDIEEGKSTKEISKVNFSSDILSDSTEFGDEMEFDDSPLFWPFDQKNSWDLTLDCFCLSPRKGIENTSPWTSKKVVYSVTSSVRLRMRPKEKKSKRGCVFKPTQFKNGICKNNNVGHRKRIRAISVKYGKSIEEIKRLVSIIGMNKNFSEVESTPNELPIESFIGLNEFDGHEGVDSEFEEDNFSLEEYMRD